MYWRLYLAYGLLVLLAVGLLGLAVTAMADRDARRQTRDRAESAARLAAAAAARDTPTANVLRDRLAALSPAAGVELSLRAAGDLPEGGSACVPVATADDGGLAVCATLPAERVRADATAAHRLLWAAVCFTAFVVAVPALALVRRVTQPLHELTEGVRRVAEGGFGHTVAAGGSDEVGVLARTFNQMSQRLARQFRQLEEDREQLRTILSGMEEGVVAIDADQRVLFANERAGALLGFALRNAIGRKLWEVVRQRAVHQVVERVLAGGDPKREEIDWQGSVIRFLTLYVARLPGRPCPGAVLVINDTSELRRLERMRQDFVANVSHELKTPLSVIKLYVDTLLNGAVEDPVHRGGFLEQIADQAERLHALIMDLLSLARIESGAGSLELQSVGLDQAVGDSLDRHRARAGSRNVGLEALPPEGEEGPVAWADPEAVGTIVDNLVDNAVKYTPEGGRVWVEWGQDEAEVWVRVRDNGIGIPERDLPRIFERFYRVDKARSRELGGTGLGLSIVKHLVQIMNGRVAAESEVGRGTTFTIHLPRSQEA